MRTHYQEMNPKTDCLLLMKSKETALNKTLSPWEKSSFSWIILALMLISQQSLMLNLLNLA